MDLTSSLADPVSLNEGTKVSDDFVDKLNQMDLIRLIVMLLANKDRRQTVLKILKSRGEQLGQNVRIEGKGSNSYSTEKFGMMLKPVVDQIAAENKDKIIRFASFGRLAPQSAKMLVYGALHWLCMHHPDKIKYQLVRLNYRIKPTTEGIALLKQDQSIAATIDSLVFEDFSETVVVADWEEELDTWIDTSEPGGKPFMRDNLVLSLEEQHRIRLTLASSTLVADVRASSIRVLKLKPDQPTP